MTACDSLLTWNDSWWQLVTHMQFNHDINTAQETDRLRSRVNLHLASSSTYNLAISDSGTASICRRNSASLPDTSLTVNCRQYSQHSTHSLDPFQQHTLQDNVEKIIIKLTFLIMYCTQAELVNRRTPVMTIGFSVSVIFTVTSKLKKNKCMTY